MLLPAPSLYTAGRMYRVADKGADALSMYTLHGPQDFGSCRDLHEFSPKNTEIFWSVILLCCNMVFKCKKH